MADLDFGPESQRRWEPSAAEIRRLGGQVVELIAEHLAGDPDPRAWRPFPNDVARRMLDSPLPAEGEPAGAVLERFAAELLPYPFGNGHPRFFGWVNGPPVVLGVLAEALAAAMNPSVAGGNHAATYVEHEALGWLKDLVGYPREAGGLLVSGGSAATLVGLAVARQRASGGDVRARGLSQDTRPLTVYATAEAHSAIAKAVELLGLGSDHLHELPVDSGRRMRVDALRAAVARDAGAGAVPMAVVASAGTVASGAIDPLAELAAACRELGLWLHVDGAYGAPAILDARYRERLEPLAEADSLALDAHKWLGVPYDCGAVLVRDAELMRSTFSLVAPYLQQQPDPAGVSWLPWFSEYGPEQTRAFRALKLWMALRHHGRAGYAESIARDVGLAELLAELVDARPELELVAHGLSIVCLRCRPPGVAEGELDELNQRVLRALQLSGEAFLTSTRLDGRLVLRACLINPRTRAADVRRLVELIVESAGREA